MGFYGNRISTWAFAATVSVIFHALLLGVWVGFGKAKPVPATSSPDRNNAAIESNPELARSEKKVEPPLPTPPPASETPSWVDRASLENNTPPSPPPPQISEPKTRSASSVENATPGAAENPAGAKSKIYIVKRGDNLTRIAERDGSTVAELARLNGSTVKKLSNLWVGQKIKLKNGID